jgi:hypothetical protein
MKNLLGDFSAKVGREEIFKPTIGNEILHEISNVNGVRVVIFGTSEDITVKSTLFPHHNIHKFIWTSPGGKMHNQIDHIFIDRRRHSSVIMSSHSGQQCDTDQYVVTAEVTRVSCAARLNSLNLRKWFTLILRVAVLHE